MKALIIYQGELRTGTYYPPTRWKDLKKELKRGKYISLDRGSIKLVKNKDIICSRETEEDIKRDFPQYFI